MFNLYIYVAISDFVRLIVVYGFFEFSEEILKSRKSYVFYVIHSNEFLNAS